MSGEIFTIIYLCIMFYVILRIVSSVKKNGKSALITDKTYRSPAYNAVMEAINRDSGANEASVSNSSVRVDRPPVTSEPASASRINDNKAFEDSYKPRTDRTSGNMNKEAPVSRLMDDREHDWLARQLAEERIAKKRMSDMFELRKEHAANCDAHNLKAEHMNNCDAEGTVDAASGRQSLHSTIDL